MKTEIVINKLIFRTFDLIRVNQVLLMPLLTFLLILDIFLGSIVSINAFIMIAVLALQSVFLSGWLNMFHLCLENSDNEMLPDAEKTLKSLDLYKGFFPGVGKHFQKIFWGIIFGFVLLIFIINVGEAITMHFLGAFKNFSPDNFVKMFHDATTKTDLIAFWNNINHTDKVKIYKLLMVDLILITAFSYLSMLWLPFVIVDDKNPVHAFFLSAKAVLKDFLNTFIIFILITSSYIFILSLRVLLKSNIFSELLILMFSVYILVYYTMMVFLYFERYKQAK